jgi:NAD(P)-dependent dehydrogenase (short-subunit alcohol dehydrogenase family)
MAYSIDLSGRVAFVTGASSGLGAQFAKTLARAGAAVVLASRRVEKLKELRARIEGEGGDAHVVELDVTDHGSIKAAVARAETEVGPIDILVNNSGVNIRSKLQDVTPDDYDFIFDTNLKGAFFVAQEVGKRMLARADGSAPGTYIGGRIINIASVAGAEGGGQHRRLRHEQGRGGADDQGHGAGVGPLRHQRERAVPGLHRHRTQRRTLDHRGRRQADRASCRASAWARPKTSTA